MSTESSNTSGVVTSVTSFPADNSLTALPVVKPNPLSPSSLDKLKSKKITANKLKMRKHLTNINDTCDSYGVLEKVKGHGHTSPFRIDFWEDKDLEVSERVIAGTNRFVSAEIEISTVQNYKQPYWTDIASVCSDIKGDGSVNDEGLEVCTMPAKGLAFLKIMRVLDKNFEKTKAFADKSCGIHVHVDVQNYEALDFFKLGTLWARIYPEVQKLIPGFRSHSGFCDWPTSISILEKKFILNSSKLDCVNRVHATLSSHGRYTALNFLSYEKHGTVEFRCHEGTTNTKLIQNWAILCSTIVDFAKNNTLTTIRSSSFADVVASINNANKASMDEYLKFRPEYVKKLENEHVDHENEYCDNCGDSPCTC